MKKVWINNCKNFFLKLVLIIFALLLQWVLPGEFFILVVLYSECSSVWDWNISIIFMGIFKKCCFLVKYVQHKHDISLDNWKFAYKQNCYCGVNNITLKILNILSAVNFDLKLMSYFNKASFKLIVVVIFFTCYLIIDAHVVRRLRVKKK